MVLRCSEWKRQMKSLFFLVWLGHDGHNNTPTVVFVSVVLLFITAVFLTLVFVWHLYKIFFFFFSWGNQTAGAFRTSDGQKWRNVNGFLFCFFSFLASVLHQIDRYTERKKTPSDWLSWAWKYFFIKQNKNRARTDLYSSVNLFLKCRKTTFTSIQVVVYLHLKFTPLIFTAGTRMGVKYGRSFTP